MLAPWLRYFSRATTTHIVDHAKQAQHDPPQAAKLEIKMRLFRSLQISSRLLIMYLDQRAPEAESVIWAGQLGRTGHHTNCGTNSPVSRRMGERRFVIAVLFANE